MLCYVCYVYALPCLYDAGTCKWKKVGGGVDEEEGGRGRCGWAKYARMRVLFIRVRYLKSIHQN